VEIILQICYKCLANFKEVKGHINYHGRAGGLERVYVFDDFGEL
jgi:hypothetical protein